jgi:hypothetical protein
MTHFSDGFLSFLTESSTSLTFGNKLPNNSEDPFGDGDEEANHSIVVDDYEFADVDSGNEDDDDMGEFDDDSESEPDPDEPDSFDHDESEFDETDMDPECDASLDPDCESNDFDDSDEDDVDVMMQRESLSFLRSLLTEKSIGKKRVPIKTAQKAVYHRDYVKTKKKPYRKYHPEQTNEGFADYAKSMASSAGSGIANAGRSMANAGRSAVDAVKQVPGQIQQKAQAAHANASTQSAIGDAKSAAYKLAVTIHKYLKLKNSAPVQEGLMDYMRGAGQETGKKINAAVQPIRDIHSAGKERSRTADMAKLNNEAKIHFTELVRLLNRVPQDQRIKTLQSILPEQAPAKVKAMILKQFTATMPNPFRASQF